MKYSTTTSNIQPLLNSEEAGAYLQLSNKTVIRMARERALPAIRIGKHWRFRAEDLAAWAALVYSRRCQPVG